MNQLPKLSINKFQAALALPEVDRFDFDIIGTKLLLTIHEGNGRKVAVIHSTFQVYGWTEDMSTAFEYKNNGCIYTANELYELARGRAI